MEATGVISIAQRFCNIPYMFDWLSPVDMRFFLSVMGLAAGSTLVAPPPVLAQPSACMADAGGPAVKVTAQGFKDRKGNLRIAVYNANEEEFLASGRYVQRIDTPMTASGPMTICVPLPTAGPYAVVALHDRDADGKLSVFSDGFGFSNNPKLGRSKPPVSSVTMNVQGVSVISITLNYVQGFSPKPWKPH